MLTACSALPLQGATPPEATHLQAVQARAGGLGAAAFSPEGAAAPADWQSQIRGPGLKEPIPLPSVSFAVPSGNFGNVCAGHVARMMGLPIDQLVVATNENDVLDEFFRTGVYRVRAGADTHETSSPSMDISKASNFERFVFDLLGRDGAKTAGLFGRQLSNNGMFDLSADPAFKQAAAKYGFISGKSTHANRLATIQEVFARHRMIIDTHTADGVKVARQHAKPGVPMIVLETALPIKFAATIVEALGREPDRPAKFEGIEALPKRVTPMRADVAAIQAFIRLNCQ